MSDADAGRTYEIRTVLDFLTVPAERRAVCLAEFATFLEMIEPTCELLNVVADVAVGPGAVKFHAHNVFRWIDDERRMMGCFVRFADGTEQTVYDLTPADAARMAEHLAAIAASESATSPARVSSPGEER